MSDVYGRLLSDSFEKALATGALKPLLHLVRCDRDLIAEIRKNRLEIYCKGNLLLRVDQRARGDFQFWSGFKYWESCLQPSSDGQDIKHLCDVLLPTIKQEIALHSATGKEIEFEQMLIRSCNLERLNTDYIAVDRQVSASGQEGRVDVIGVFWPGNLRNTNNLLKPTLIEVKYGLNGGIETVASQVQGYYNNIKIDFPAFVSALQAQLRQKARLGLLSGLSANAQEAIQVRDISNSIDDLKVAVVLMDYNPRSTRLFAAKAALQRLPFHANIDIFHAGFGLWKENSIFHHSNLTSEMPEGYLDAIHSEEGNIIFEDVEGFEVAAEMRHVAQQKRLHELALFRPIFESADFRFASWHLASLSAANGMAPYCILSEGAKQFIKAAINFSSLLSFDWSEWLEGAEAKQLCKDQRRISKAGYEQLAKLLTSHVQNDRMNPGALNAAFESGILTAIVQRAQALLGG